MTDKEKLVEQFTEHARRLATKLVATSDATAREKIWQTLEADGLIEGYEDMPDWLSPKDVAPLVAKSKRWVQTNIELFTGTRRDDNGYYLIPKRSVLRYLLTRTEEVSP